MKTCSKHPKFKGNKLPTNQCMECLAIYTALKGRRIPTAPPSKAHKSIKDYRRKDKHPKKLD